MRARNTLTIYRRHTTDCTKQYAQNYRVYRPQTQKDRKLDCECPIAVDGRLELEPNRIRRISLETNDWEVADRRRAQWEKWGSLADPSPMTVENPTVEQVIVRFNEYHSPNFKEWSKSYRKKFDQLFNHRLRPFCEMQNAVLIRHFDTASLVEEFVTSWRNKNAHHRRPSDATVGIPLGYRTKVKELERFRYFCRWCVRNGWLRFNHAAGIRLVYEDVEPKFGLNPDEEDRVFGAIELLEDCYGRPNQRNAREARAFCLLMRHTGLRISDATELDSGQLVPRDSSNGWVVQVLAQQKTKTFVRIPIPSELHEALSVLPFKGQRDGKRYWFYTGVGTIETAIKTWRKRVTKLLAVAQAPADDGTYEQPFEHHATPHTFRHTFAIAHLNAGTDIKIVSRWLGHQSVAITEKHYGHANRETHITSEAAYDESLKRQTEARKRAQNRVVKIRHRNA
jgi:integrase